MSADLHCHTTMSDGSDTPEFVVGLAKRLHLSAVALTDHDYYAGDYRAHEIGERVGIGVIEGVECSCRDRERGNKVHLLCYNCKYPEAMAELLAKVTKARTEAVMKMTALVAHQFPITEEAVMDGVSGSGFVGKQHIMLALMKAGYASEMYGTLYRSLFHAKTGSCFVPFEDNDALEAVKVLRETGGVIVLAHPTVYGSIASLDDLIGAGIHGIELHHPDNTPEHKAAIAQAAQQHGLLLTGGTDFHGFFTETGRLKPLGTCTASDEQLAALLEKSAQLWSEN